jgi:hypothetical protein
VKIVDDFARGPLPRWVRLATGPAEVLWEAGHLRFAVEGAVGTQLADSEIGDYRGLDRRRLPWRAPLRMVVRARFSRGAEDLAGTSGFGLWNDPFDLAGGGLLAPPNALWFFHASPRSDMVTAPGLPGNGFRAEAINSGTMPGWLAGLAGRLLRLPGLAPLLYRAAQTRVHAEAVRLDGVEMTACHEYELEWGREEAVFYVDGREVLRAPRPPAVPLGFVAWMDNQVAVARPDGAFHFGLEAAPEWQWLELERVEIEGT